MAAVILNEHIDSDELLIARSRGGDSHAYATLYERHRSSALAAARCLTRSGNDADDVVSESFARVLNVLRGGKGPTESFRPYLMTVVRNTVYERTRRTRESPSDLICDIADIASADAADRDAEARIAREAFESLPERWQLILWHTEVEGRSPADVAPLLGLAPNSVAALAYRAREGLRQAYLQAHVGAQPDRECRTFSATFGAYIRDSMPARERSAVDAHLTTCEPCRITLEELRPTNERLRVLLIFAFLGVPAATYLDEFHKSVGATQRSSGARSRGRVARILSGSAVAASVVIGGVILAARGNDSVTPVALAAVTTISTTTPSTSAPLTAIASTTTAASTTTTSTSVETTVMPTRPALAVVSPAQIEAPVTAAPTTTEALNTTTTYLVQNLDMTATPIGVGTAGGGALVQLSIANTGPSDIANTQVKFLLPPDFGVTSSEVGVVCEVGSWICSFGLMHPGDTLNVTVTITIPVGAISPLINWGLFVLEGTSSATTDPIPFI